MDIDLAKFFDTVDHDKLMTIFGTPQRLSFSREYVIYYRGKIVGRVYDDCFLVKPVRG